MAVSKTLLVKLLLNLWGGSLPSFHFGICGMSEVYEMRRYPLGHFLYIRLVNLRICLFDMTNKIRTSELALVCSSNLLIFWAVYFALLLLPLAILLSRWRSILLISFGWQILWAFFIDTCLMDYFLPDLITICLLKFKIQYWPSVGFVKLKWKI